jgi:YVTN family beta-propeller protein
MMSGTVSVIDLHRARKITDIEVGGYPEGIAITPDGKELWVGDNSGGRVRIVDLAKRVVVATLESDPVPIRVAISPDGKTAVTSHIGSGTLNVFDVAKRSKLRTIPVSGEKEAVQVTAIFSRDGEMVFVAETGRDMIAEVDIESGEVLRRLSVGKGGDGLGIAP